ncbi:MAG: VPLPA-CTERM sorting domain-containing protein [Steroidobacteraceae bacterium]
MKISLKQVLATGALVAMSSVALADSNDAVAPAYASIGDVTPVTTNTTNNNGGLQFMLFNSDVGGSVWSLSQYLGLNLNDVLPTNMDASDGAGLTLSWTIPTLSSLVSSSGVATADLRWGVAAADTAQFLTAAAGTMRLATTVLTSTGDLGITNQQLANTTPRHAAVAAANNQTAGSLDVNTTGFVGNDLLGNLSTTYYATGGFTWAGTVSDTLAMYLYSNTGSSLQSQANVEANATQYAGIWSLDLANNLLSYTVSPSSPVPVPAAIWLLLSGLGGLGVIGRRKAA